MSAALIIIDLIEDLIGPKGRANHCREQVAATHLLANVNAAAAYARVRKIPVIWVRVGFADDYHDIPPHSPLFNHLKQIGALRLNGPLSAPFTMYYNFDKAMVQFLLFACLPTLFSAERGGNGGKAGWIALLLAVPALLLLAVALGGLKIELHAPAWILPFVMANLFFVCMAEEALFRGYLQQRLSQWLGAWPALIVASLVFGAAHLAGGTLMVIFATLAGVIYGLAWMWSGRLWVPILFHFGLNLTHLLFFTYPLYQHP